MGNIGRRVPGIDAAFGCRVIFHSVTGTSSCKDYPQVDKATLLTESDILSLHCPQGQRQSEGVLGHHARAVIHHIAYLDPPALTVGQIRKYSMIKRRKS